MYIVCSRCSKQVEKSTNPDCTMGYYETTYPSFWSKFANEKEEYLCDACMFREPRYIKVYGHNSLS